MRKIVLITGGSRGIGAACVRAFAEDGYAVAFLYKSSRGKAEALVSTLRNEGLDVSAKEFLSCAFYRTIPRVSSRERT